jgi:RNA recognition motif-containing protein
MDDHQEPLPMGEGSQREKRVYERPSPLKPLSPSTTIPSNNIHDSSIDIPKMNNNNPQSVSVDIKTTHFYAGPRDPSLPPSQPHSRVYVSNLNFDTGWRDLKEFMGQIGRVLFVDILTTHGGTKSKVYSFFSIYIR